MSKEKGHWIIKYDGPDGWQRITECVCSECGESALLKRNIDMDGSSYDLKPSKYCPSCGLKMEGVT